MKHLFTFVLLILPWAVHAQVQFGYLSYKKIVEEMPEYAQTQQQMATLRAKYEAEATRGEEEFQKKFVEFLQGQKDFPQSIMQKRQAELQGLMNKGVEFRLQSQELLEQADKELMAELYKKLNRAILEVGVEFGYGFILNTDDNSCPYINPVIGVDVSELVRQKLGLVTAVPPVPAVATPDSQPLQKP